MAKIDKDDVLKLAQLSKLNLTDDQAVKFGQELKSLLEYIDQLQSVDTEGLEPANQVTGLTNVMRNDEICETVGQKDLLKNAPALEGDLIKVKRVIE